MSFEPSQSTPEKPLPEAHPPAGSSLMGLAVGAIVAAVCASPLMLRKNGYGLVVAFLTFVVTVAIWTLVNRSRNLAGREHLEPPVVAAKRRIGRMWLAVAALFIGPIGGALVGYLIVLNGNVNPLDVSITIRAPMFIGGFAGFVVASGVFVTAVLE